MPKRQPEFFVVDILIAIDKITRAVAGLTFKTFISDERVVDSTLRNLEIIGEATGQLLKDAYFLKETDVEWRKIVNFRNVIIHFYFGVDLNIVFNMIILNEIPLLEQNILDLMKQKKDITNFLLALEDTKADLADLHRSESIAYLEKIEEQFRPF